MKISMSTQLKIDKPPAEVFEAWVDPVKMAGYFISRGTARMEAGKTVTWHWDDAGAKADVEVVEVSAPRRLVFRWGVTGSMKTVEVDFEPQGSATLVKVRTGDWENDAAGVAAYGDQMQGFVHLLLCLKASLQYGINLRA